MASQGILAGRPINARDGAISLSVPSDLQDRLPGLRPHDEGDATDRAKGPSWALGSTLLWKRSQELGQGHSRMGAGTRCLHRDAPTDSQDYGTLRSGGPMTAGGGRASSTVRPVTAMLLGVTEARVCGKQGHPDKPTKLLSMAQEHDWALPPPTPRPPGAPPFAAPSLCLVCPSDCSLSTWHHTGPSFLLRAQQNAW